MSSAGIRILAFAGSTRRSSWNKALVAIAAKEAKALGAEVTLIDLKDYPLPLFDEDFEAEHGLPEAGRKLKDLFLTHDALLIASPEYNSSITAVLKNTIDWVSRPAPGEKPLQAFSGKTSALISASPGLLGGIRGLVTLRSILGNIGVLVIPSQLAVASASDAFDDGGELKDARKSHALKGVVESLVQVTRRMKV